MPAELNIDALLPHEMAVKAEAFGVRKAAQPFLPLFTLSILAGAFIGLGAMLSTVVAAGTASLPYGVARLLIGFSFCIGLILVVIGGAELFTGNNLIIMAWASRKVSFRALMRNWGVVYLGNLVGSMGTAFLVFLSRQYTFDNGSVGTAALKIAAAKVHLGFFQAVMLGLLCNVLVCLAVWLTYSARSTTDKILAILFPVTAFVAASFEHSVANMYFIPHAIFIKWLDPSYAAMLAVHFPYLSELTWTSFLLKNLIPVTLGNIIGGGGLVAATYWFIYLRGTKKN